MCRGWYLALFGVGFVGYPIIELIWRGHTHISMAWAGGLSLLWMGWLSARPIALPLAALLSTLGVGVIELGIGAYVNLYLGLGVWDYSALPYHLWGQVCPEYMVLWFLLSLVLVYLVRLVRRWMLVPRRSN